MKTQIIHIDELSNVKNTEIIPSAPDRPSIMVSLHEPVNMIDVLKKFPEVAECKEEAGDMDSTNGKLRKIKVTLSGADGERESVVKEVES